MIPQNVHDLFINRKNISEDKKIDLYEVHLDMLYKTACDLEEKSKRLEKEVISLQIEINDLERKYQTLSMLTEDDLRLC